jgi:ketosteroid isomerase-like protein
MRTEAQTLIDLETKFWQSMVDNDADTAVAMLNEPALMVSPHGAMKFDNEAYRKMADQGPMVLTSFELSDMEVVFPNDATAVLTYRVKQGVAPRGTGDSAEEEMNDTSTWIRAGKQWRCVMHTETPVADARR